MLDLHLVDHDILQELSDICNSYLASGKQFVENSRNVHELDRDAHMAQRKRPRKEHGSGRDDEEGSEDELSSSGSE